MVGQNVDEDRSETPQWFCKALATFTDISVLIGDRINTSVQAYACL
jgi:hypothetical protein